MDDVASRLRGRLVERSEIVFAYLFGSQASGRTHPRSDVDVAVWLREPYDRSSYALLSSVLAEATSALGRDDVDLVVLNEAPLTLAFEALGGSLIFSRDESVRLVAESSLMRRYHDRAYYRERYLDAVAKNVAERGFS